MVQYEYASEYDLQSNIRASADGGSWEAWRVDAAGTSWYRRRVDGQKIIRGATVDDDPQPSEPAMVEAIVAGEKRLVPAIRIPGGDVTFER